MTKKEYQIFITKDQSKKSETEFASYNLKAYSLKVGEPIWVPSELYDYVLSKGNLKDRVQKLQERAVK